MQSDSGKGNATANIPDPKIQIRQISSVAAAAQHVEGGFPVHYALRVQNNAAEPITLKQVTVGSMGMGGYNLPQTSRPFKTVIQPAQAQDVEFWVPAFATDTIVGANGPVTLRLVAQFDSPMGQFQRVVVTQVNSMTGVDGSNQ